jgi:hypothetical protein
VPDTGHGIIGGMRKPAAALIPPALLLAAILVLTGCGGSSTVTLHGTFTDVADTSSGQSCADQGTDTLSGAGIAVAVDGVAAGTGTVSWAGNPVNAGTGLGGDAVYGCTGTWAVTVPSARIGYALSITGLGGVTGSVTIPAADAGKAIPLDDEIGNDQGGNALEVSP